jgi:hypothetical protein
LGRRKGEEECRRAGTRQTLIEAGAELRSQLINGWAPAGFARVLRISIGVMRGSQRDLSCTEDRFGRGAYRFKPTADIHLGVSFPTEMAGGRTHSGSQFPFDDRKIPVSTLDHKPMGRISTDDSANFALKFLQTRHAFSVEQ